MEIKFKRLLINGCSFSGERIKAGVDTFAAKIIAEYYNLPIIQMSMAGRGNRRIFSSTMMYFEKNFHEIKDTFVIIQWSTPLRKDYPTIKDQPEVKAGQTLHWKSWKIHEETNFLKSKNQWHVDNELGLHTLEYVIALQNYFKQKNINYIMYFGLDPQINAIKHVDIQNLQTAIDYSRIFNYTSDHMTWCFSKNLVCSDKDPHPNQQGQIEWGKSLLNWIKDNNFIVNTV